ncbi:MAG: hypothetical protein FWD78_05845 [Treponema sp.]|nr:hypothetical protein [Treponema sp.]
MEHPKKPPIKWHTAFIEAIKLELEEYQNSLEFYPEFQLTAEPLRIDCVVVKKKTDIVIKKNIASIFREVNLLEYKNPEDYVSVNDFYKVYAYACLYASLERVPITNLTISLIESRRPRELFAHLQDIRGYKIEEKSHGIYTINGDILPIQIINSRKLSPEENLWLQGLRNKLDPVEVQQVLFEIFRQEKAVKFGAYLDAISRANYPAIEEAVKMSSTPKSFDEVLERAGLVAKWEARGEAKGEARGEAKGEERKAIKVAKNLINLGIPLETVASATELDLEKVKTLYQNQ